MKRVGWMAGAVLVCLPVAAFAFIKPLRVAVPAWVPGVQCVSASICTDNVAALADAQGLYREGYARAGAAVGPFRGTPRIVFCTTSSCADAFGMGRRAAMAVGNLGMIVAPRGWTPFYVAHELIHYRQAESLGNLAVATQPRWLIEGMAYSLSGDPRHPLGEPFEQWRSKFEAWHASIGSRDMWQAARDVR
ncbi:hypothetical protein [Paraburkholderia kururiensis]|uniref:Transmembrane protein n=1 Tax=Paraburkholderia kururiensis TaxID=984307 RepID=A0ABZ0WUU9_9BURK|nr:hypothetical protein [Paraburkholderia kururiensis]WQD81003.1 hypothetical protein U0042_13105 [Paraburkholderia kururiensis]